MSSPSIIRSSLIVAFALSITGVTFARLPPALEQVQRASEHATMCEGAMSQPTAGYRGASVRNVTTAGPAHASPSGAGYRDALKRFGQQNPAARVACRHPPGTHREGPAFIEQTPSLEPGRATPKRVWWW
jgi:hypothetical protein